MDDFFDCVVVRVLALREYLFLNRPADESVDDGLCREMACLDAQKGVVRHLFGGIRKAAVNSPIMPLPNGFCADRAGVKVHLHFGEVLSKLFCHVSQHRHKTYVQSVLKSSRLVFRERSSPNLGLRHPFVGGEAAKLFLKLRVQPNTSHIHPLTAQVYHKHYSGLHFLGHLTAGIVTNKLAMRKVDRRIIRPDVVVAPGAALLELRQTAVLGRPA